MLPTQIWAETTQHLRATFRSFSIPFFFLLHLQKELKWTKLKKVEQFKAIKTFLNYTMLEPCLRPLKKKKLKKERKPDLLSSHLKNWRKEIKVTQCTIFSRSPDYNAQKSLLPQTNAEWTILTQKLWVLF